MLKAITGFGPTRLDAPSIGTEGTVTGKDIAGLVKVLKERGIKFDYTAYEGKIHEMDVWRPSLIADLQKLFR